MPGQGSQVVKVLIDHTYQLDENVLGQILLKPEIKDLPVVVVSVAGAYRGGKSFLLNFFIRYLSAPLAAQQDGSWLGENTAPLIGFSWRGGSERNTTGILLWSDPFITTLPSGEKVAVVLMDTQGTFDSKSTVRDNSTIFALSTLLSSVQIYNLSMNIQEDDLQHLQLFTTYGKMVQEKSGAGKPFQTLEFLVRDWPYPYDYNFGSEGGNRLLQELLEVTPSQPQELKDLRTHIRSYFENVICYLMPHPGFKVQDPKFNGNINNVDPNFRTHLKPLVTSLLSKEKLTPKMINGQKVKAVELYNYFKAYMGLFNGGNIPTPTTILQATISAAILSAMNEARTVYENGMNQECGAHLSPVQTGDVVDIHQKYLNLARTTFTNKKTMAAQDETNRNLDKLNQELSPRLPQFEQSNLSKLQALFTQASNVYEQTLNNITKNQPLCLHPLELETVHNEAAQAAYRTYDGGVRKITNKPDQKRAELVQHLENRHAQLKMTNDKNNKQAINDLKTEYWRFMETKAANPPLSDEVFRSSHDGELNAIIAKFNARRIRQSSHPNDIFREELVRVIMDSFAKLNGVNHGKIEQERIRQEQERRRIEQERIKAEQDRVRAEQERVAREQEILRLEQEKQRAEQERQRLELERQRIEAENRRHRRRRRRCSVM